MKRSTDRDPKKQLNEKDTNVLDPNPDNGLLVTTVNQTQDLLVKTTLLSLTSHVHKSQPGTAEGAKLWVILSSHRIPGLRQAN
jgi:hypothetical protein